MDNIPKDVWQEYKLKEKATDEGWVYVEVQKGMYSSLQAGLLAQELLATRLATEEIQIAPPQDGQHPWGCLTGIQTQGKATDEGWVYVEVQNWM